MSETIKYTDAYNELQLIVSELEKSEVTIDELSEKVKRAAALIKICKSKLTETEQDVNAVLKDLREEAQL